MNINKRVTLLNLLLLLSLSPFFTNGQQKDSKNFLGLNKVLQKKDSLLHIGRNLDTAVKKYNKSIFNKPSLNFEQQSIYQNTGIDSSNLQSLINLGVQFSTFGLPIKLNISSKVFPQIGYSFNRNQLFNFKYKDQLQQFNANQYLDKFTEGALKNQLQQAKSYVKNEVDNFLKEKQNVKGFEIDPFALKQLLSTGDDNLQMKIENLVLQAKQRAIEKLPWDNTLKLKKDSLEQKAKIYKEQLLIKIETIKKDFARIGIDEKNIKDIIDYSEDKITDDEMIQILLQSQLNQNTFFSKANNWYQNIKNFNAGQFSQKLPFNNLNRDQFLNGLQIALKTRKGPVNFGFVKENNLAGLNNLEFKQNTFSQDRAVGYFKADVYQGKISKGSFSLAGTSATNNEQNSLYNTNQISQNVFALGFEQHIKTNKAGEFRFEMNKSFSRFNDGLFTDFRNQFINAQSFDQIFVNDFNQSISGGLYHQMDIEKLGLISNTYFSYSGIQFQNPGNSAFNQPRLRWGGKIRKVFFQNKLIFSLKADHRSNTFGESNNGWSSQLIDFEGKVKIIKRTYISFKYQNNVTQNNAEMLSLTSLNTSTKNIQVAGNTGFKFNSLNINSQFSLARQDILLPNFPKSNNYMLNAFNVISFGKRSISSSLFINRDLGTTPLLGNMTNLDFSYQYTISKSLFASSGVNYLDNQFVKNQIGAKQSIQFSGIKNFDMSVFLDLRKNSGIQVLPNYANTSRGEISLTYTLGKN